MRMFLLFIRLLIGTEGYAFTHLTFAMLFMLCMYNFFRAITLDPGTCPKPVNDSELKEVCFLLQTITHPYLTIMTF